jgi:hypothetical protein
MITLQVFTANGSATLDMPRSTTRKTFGIIPLDMLHNARIYIGGAVDPARDGLRDVVAHASPTWKSK